MKTFLTIILLSVSMGTIAQIKVNHIPVHVSKLQPSKDFYSGILGLTEIEEPFKDRVHA